MTKTKSPSVTFEMRDPCTLIPDPKNAKIHTETQLKQISRSIDEYGFNDPIGIDPAGNILEGHGRQIVAKRRGMIEVPVIVISGLSPKKARAYALAHNKINVNTGFDSDILSEVLADLDKADDVDLFSTGFKSDEIEELLAVNNDNTELNNMDDADTHLDSVYQLGSTLMLRDEDVGKFGIPKLNPEMLAELPELEYQMWIGSHRTTDDGERPLFYLFGSDSTLGMDTTRATVAFYVDDKRFERVWDGIQKYTSKFLNANVQALVMPDYSINWDEPAARHIFNTYRSFWIARYWQDAGIPVIPSINFTDDPESLDYMISGIPEEAPLISIQIQTMRQKLDSDYADTTRTMLGLALDRLKPQNLLVYGGEPARIIGQEICDRHGVNCIPIANRSTAMRADVAKSETTRKF